MTTTLLCVVSFAAGALAAVSIPAVGRLAERLRAQLRISPRD